MGNFASFLIYSKGPSERGSRADFEEAEQLLHQALEMNRQFRPDHPFTGDVFADLGELRLQEGNHVEAERLIREALRIYRLKLPERHRKIVFAKSQLGEVLLALGRPEEAEPLLLDSHKALTAEFKEEDEEIELVVENLIELYEAWGKPEKAAEYRALLEKNDDTNQ
jgi:tetratricopeptide (TPR) repeat protein